jgi:hypothetical protein
LLSDTGHVLGRLPPFDLNPRALTLVGEKLLCDLTLELQTVDAVLGHGLPSFESPA